MNVPKLRFKEFNAEWKKTTLQNLTFIIDGDRGKNYPKENEFYNREYCLFLNAGNVTKNGFDFSNNTFITKKKDEILRNGKLLKEDVVLTTRGTVGNVAYYDENISYQNIRINSGMVIIRINNKNICPRYLYFYMKSPQFSLQVTRLNFGSAQPQLTIKGLSKFTISYPLFKEQEKLSFFINLLDRKIELQSKKIEALKLYKKGLIDHLVNNMNIVNSKKLSQLGYTYSGLSGKSKEDFVDGNCKFITFMSVLKNNISENLFSTVKIKEKEKQNKVLKGDLFFTGSSETKEEVGMASTLNYDFDNLYLNSFCFGFRLNLLDEINNNFLCSLLLSSKYRKIISNLGQGFTRVNISKKELLDIDIEYPDYDDQLRITNILNNMYSKIKLEEEKLSKLESLKKGLMQNMFV